MSTRRELEARLVAKALADDAYRKELVRDPRAVIERELGAKVPDGITLVVHEETSDTMHIVLPLRPADRAAGVEVHEATARRAGPWGVTR